MKLLEGESVYHTIQYIDHVSGQVKAECGAAGRKEDLVMVIEPDDEERCGLCSQRS